MSIDLFAEHHVGDPTRSEVHSAFEEKLLAMVKKGNLEKTKIYIPLQMLILERLDERERILVKTEVVARIFSELFEDQLGDRLLFLLHDPATGEPKVRLDSAVEAGYSALSSALTAFGKDIVH